MSNVEETITINLSMYEELKSRDIWLSCLENAGVDNWSGIDYAYDLHKEFEKEEEDDE